MSSPEAGVIIRGVGLSAGLDKVTIALVLPVLTFELIAPINIDGVGIAIRHKVNINILANEIIHGPDLVSNEALHNREC